MTRVLVVSEASVNAPHRKPYDVLAREPGWDVHIAAPSSIPLGGGRRKQLDAAPADAAYRLHALPMPFDFASTGRFAWFKGLVPLARKLKPDVIFAEYDPGSVTVLHARVAALVCGADVTAFTVENIHHPRFRQSLEHLRARRLKPAVRDGVVGMIELAGAFSTARLACISNEGAHVFRDDKRWKKPLFVMPLGTDTDLFKPADDRALRQSLGLEGRFVVGYFGRLVPEKGVDLLVEALPHLPDDVVLLLDMFQNFAPGSYAARLLARADELGVRARVTTIDVAHGEVPRSMRCCDAIVLPSRTTSRWKEQFGRVLPEAMACGVPVIGTRSGNIPDVIGDAGVLIDESSVPAIVDAILRLRADPALGRTLGERGRTRVKERLSVDVQAQILKDFLARREPPVSARSL